MGLFATLGVNDIHHKRHSSIQHCHYAECRVTFIVMLSVVMLNVVRLSVVMLSALTRDILFTIPQSCWTFKSDKTNQQILTIHSRARLRGQRCKKFTRVIYACNKIG
jgi:hypothetical protein